MLGRGQDLKFPNLCPTTARIPGVATPRAAVAEAFAECGMVRIWPVPSPINPIWRNRCEDWREVGWPDSRTVCTHHGGRWRTLVRRLSLRVPLTPVAANAEMTDSWFALIRADIL